MTAEPKAAPVRPTAERIAQGGVIENPEVRGERPKPWWTFESPHDGLLAAGLISKEAWEGAQDFQQTYMIANGSGVGAAGLEPAVNGSKKSITEAAANAKLKIARWSRQLAPELFKVLEDVLGWRKSLTEWATRERWHQATSRQLLCIALEQFARSCGGRA